MQSYFILLICICAIILDVGICKTEGNTETNNVAIAEKSSNVSASGDQKVAASAQSSASVSSPPVYNNSPSFLPDYWRSNFGQAIIVGGIIVSTVAILAGLTWLVAPFFGLRLCNILGNCEKSAVTHSNGGNLQDPTVQGNSFSDMQQYMYPGSYNMAGYNKRSVNYIGPILKTLASAYEKYDQSSTSKKE